MGLGKCTEKTSPLNRVYRLTTAFGIPIGLGKYTEETSPLSKVYRFAAVFGIPEDLANTSKKQKLLLNYQDYFAFAGFVCAPTSLAGRRRLSKKQKNCDFEKRCLTKGLLSFA